MAPSLFVAVALSCALGSSPRPPVPAQVITLPAAGVAQARADAWLGADKLQHFWASYAVTTFGFAAARSAGLERRDALAAGIAASAVAGVGKELIDRRGGGPFSVRDLVADALGTAAAWFLLREVR